MEKRTATRLPEILPGANQPHGRRSIMRTLNHWISGRFWTSRSFEGPVRCFLGCLLRFCTSAEQRLALYEYIGGVCSNLCPGKRIQEPPDFQSIYIYIYRNGPLSQRSFGSGSQIGAQNGNPGKWNQGLTPAVRFLVA